MPKLLIIIANNEIEQVHIVPAKSALFLAQKAFSCFVLKNKGKLTNWIVIAQYV